METMVDARARRFSEGIPPKLPPPRLYFFNDNDPLCSPRSTRSHFQYSADDDDEDNDSGGGGGGSQFHRRFDVFHHQQHQQRHLLEESESNDFIEDDELEAALEHGFRRAVTRAEAMPATHPKPRPRSRNGDNATAENSEEVEKTGM